jgi:epoxyqueuosine reductase
VTGERPSDARDAIRERALAAGFDAVGFAPAALAKTCGERLREFLDGGHHGDMGWLAATAERRADPKALWPEARSAVVLALNYGPVEDPLKLLREPRLGNISVYARNRDYHDMMKKRLKNLARWINESFQAEVKVFVDTAPVMEKPLAQAAGLGWQGKHSNLLSRTLGNWFFLGEVFTTLDLAPSEAETDHCGSCRACLDICPTKAFPAPYRLDARRCISYLTIEHKGHIGREFRKGMGNRIYGCDDCLAVCPWNKFARRTGDPDFLPRAELTAPRLDDLAELDEQSFRRVFAGSPIKRTGRDRFVRNVLIAIGNSGDRALLNSVRPPLDDGSPLVRAMAVWAFRQLAEPREITQERQRRSAGEDDPEVAAEWVD